MAYRINIVGAAGAGTTAVGVELSKHLGSIHLDADDFLWLPTEPPYQEMRGYKEKNEMAYRAMVLADSFVISGSLSSWQERITKLLNGVVYLDVPTDVRLARLTEREKFRFGKIDQDFYNWAAQYDEGKLPGRSRRKHEEWLDSMSCKILRLDGVLSVQKSVELILRELQ